MLNGKVTPSASVSEIAGSALGSASYIAAGTAM